MESESLIFNGLEIPRDYQKKREVKNNGIKRKCGSICSKIGARLHG